MATAVAAMSGVQLILQNAQTSGNGTIVAPPPSFRHHEFIITGSTGVSAGAVQVETGTDPNDPNTWAAVGGAATTVVANADLLVEVAGLFQFLRARISTAIVGGTVTVTYFGAKSY